MTIHSDWARLFHEECPSAFQNKPNISLRSLGVGIIDGHLQVMCLNSRMENWNSFIYALFVSPIMQLFKLGCPRVVLCFDSYDSVPAYKSMTQTKRMQAVKDVCIFEKRNGLPETIPEDPMLFLMNRDFKLMLIEMICDRLPSMLKLQPEQEFILDYKRVVRYSAGSMMPLLLDGFYPMGESDVKFARYVDKYGNALVHAIDGDYMAITLLYYATHGLKDTNKIFIYRQLSSLDNKKPDSKKKEGARTKHDEVQAKIKEEPGSRKRARGEHDVQERKTEKKQKCWVDMQLLFAVISRCMEQCSRGGINHFTNAPFTECDAVHAAVFIMLCAGTDFSRPLPLIGPKRIWDLLPEIGNILIQAIPLDGNPSESMLINGVISKLYRIVFPKHTFVSPTYAKTLLQLKSSKLSNITKDRLPSEEQVLVTIRNIKWVMDYWKMHNGSVPTPFDASNGFVICPSSGLVSFADKICKPNSI